MYGKLSHLRFRSIPGQSKKDVRYLSSYIQTFVNHPRTLRFPRTTGKVVVSTFSGGECLFGMDTLEKGWAFLKRELSKIAPVSIHTHLRASVPFSYSCFFLGFLTDTRRRYTLYLPFSLILHDTQAFYVWTVFLTWVPSGSPMHYRPNVLSSKE